MNHTFISIAIFIFISVGIVSANNTSVVLTPPMSPTPYPRAPSVNRISITATLNDTELYLVFSNAVNLATITITDETGFPVYQQSMDTNTDSVMTIPVGGFDCGNFTITIQYGSNIVTGNFVL